MLSYAELNRRANRLANRIVALGAAPGACVVVCSEPSLDSAVALLAILKAGAVYVPLDPSYPEARARVILDDTRPAVVLTRAAHAGRLAGSYETVALDAVDLSDELAVPPAIDLAPTDLAYIFYTSGTTGRPKGVMATHANLAHYLQAARDRYDSRRPTSCRRSRARASRSACSS